MNTQWLKTHQKQAAAGAAVLLVVLLALRARKNSAAATSGGLPGVANGSGVGIAGLSGTPDTTLTDLQNTLQDQLNSELGQFQTNVNAQIGAIPSGPAGPRGPAGPAGPTPPAPAPRPAPKPIARKAPVIGKPINRGRAIAPPPRTYTVVHGDTLSGIAAKYGMPLSSLEGKNRQISNPNLIFPGQKVNL